MKNFMDFKTFSMNENYYYNDFSGVVDKERTTKIGRSLEAMRGRVRRDIKDSVGYNRSGGRGEVENLDSANWLIKQTFAGVLGLGAAAADLFGSKKDKDKKDKTPNQMFKGWSEDLGPKTTEKDLEGFVKKSETEGIKRYGKDWSYDSPRGEDQKKFSEFIKKGETEIVKRMK